MTLTEGKTRGQVKPRPNSPRPNAPPPSGSPQTKPDMSIPMSQREIQWWEFADAVAKHLRDYTVPQYGDVGEDEITGYDTETCVNHCARYAKRYGTQSREGQQELDFMKIAHYAQCAWEKHRMADEVKPKQFGYVLTDMDGVDDPENYEFIDETTFRGKAVKIYKTRIT